MIIRLVASGDFHFSKLRQPFAVNLDAAGNGGGWSLLSEDMAHVVEEPSSGQHDRGLLQAVPAIQEKLSIFVALGS